jgi:hypothetical protein
MGNRERGPVPGSGGSYTTGLRFTPPQTPPPLRGRHRGTEVFPASYPTTPIASFNCRTWVN